MSEGYGYRHLQQHFFIGLLLAGIVLLFFILRPYLPALVSGAAFAVVFYPVYRRLRQVTGGVSAIAALLTCVIVLLVVIIPLTFFGLQIFREARGLYIILSSQGSPFPSQVLMLVESYIRGFYPDFSVDITMYSRQLVSWLLQHLGFFFSSAAALIINLFLSLLSVYYLLRDGDRLKRTIIYYSPLLDRYDATIFVRLKTAITSIIKGSLVIALLQGIATGIGFQLFGVPNPALWGSVAVIAALVPNVGTSLVVTPAVIYLFVKGQPLAGFGLVAWGVTAVGLLDNLLGPKLIERGTRMHPLLILLSVLGSIRLFGPIGFLLGPIILSLLLALLEIYPLILEARKTNSSSVE